jgi:hypothetical protein
MEELVKYLVSQLVSKPEAVQLITEEKNDCLYLYLSVDPDDMARIIGKKGRIIKALRQAVHLKSILTHKRTFLVLQE